MKSPANNMSTAEIFNGTILEIRIDNMHYGIKADTIFEIQDYRKSSPVPNTPDYIEGIYIYSDNVIVNVNLIKLLGLDIDYTRKKLKNIIVYYDESYIGLIADEVIGMYDIRPEMMEENADSKDGEFILSSIKNNNNNKVKIIDIDKLLQIKKNLYLDI